MIGVVDFVDGLNDKKNVSGRNQSGTWKCTTFSKTTIKIVVGRVGGIVPG